MSCLRKTLRDLGFGKTPMENLVAAEVEDLCSNLQKHNGEFVDMDGKFQIPAVNALYKVMTHEQLSHDDTRLIEIQKKTDELNRIINKPWFFFAGMVPGGVKVLESLGFPSFFQVMPESFTFKAPDAVVPRAPSNMFGNCAPSVITSDCRSRKC